MAVMPISITQPKLLLGEGREEVVYFNALLTHLNIHDVQVTEYGGKAKLRDYLRALAVPPVTGFSSVVSMGVTRDADDDAVAAFASVCSAIQGAGLAVPTAPGTVAGTRPQVCVWIMPDGKSPGMLEDLCLAAVQTDPAMICVDDYFQCVSQKATRQPKPIAKARVHAWLASQADPDLRLGEAPEKGYWPWNSPAFVPLAQFLQAL